MPEQTPQEAAWQAIAQLFMSQRPRMLDAAAKLGLNPPQALALQRLEPGVPMPMGRLAEILHCDASNVTGIADRLEAAGLAERRAGERDRRVKTLALTEKGARMRERYLSVLRVPPPAVAELSDAEAGLLRDLLAPSAHPRTGATAP